MRRAHHAGVLIIGTAVIVLATGPGIAAQFTPPLADVARQEAERRKSITASARVYTNADLGGARPPLTVTGVATPAPLPSTSAQAPRAAPPPATTPPVTTASMLAAEPAAAAGPRRDEDDAEGLAERLVEAHRTLEQTRAALEVQRMKVTLLEAEWVGAADEATRTATAEARDAAAMEADRLRGDIDAQLNALSRFEQDALRQLRAARRPR